MRVKHIKVVWKKETIVMFVIAVLCFYASIFAMLFFIPAVSSPPLIAAIVLIAFFALVALLFTGVVSVRDIHTEEVDVEKLLECEMTLSKAFKALITTKQFLLLFVFAFLLTVIFSEFADMFAPVIFGGIFGGLFGISITSNGKLIISDKGIVRYKYLTTWDTFSGYDVKGDAIVLYSKNFPSTVVPYSDEIVKLLNKFFARTK